MSESVVTPKEKLAADLRSVVADTEELLKATAGQAGEKVNAVRSRLEQSVGAVKARIGELEAAAVEKARAAAKATDVYVHENPWPAIGMAAGMGFILGLLIRRR
jgi:ElaB/YqjD/DUF883 family membrane-anchored ribosome-binding protein